MNKEISQKKPLDEIDILKGIAILGVIIFHLVPSLINDSVKAFFVYTVLAYSIQIFAFSSGFLFGLSSSTLSSFSDYSAFALKKFKRLMIPYFVISFILLALKYVGALFVTINHPVGSEFWRYLIFAPLKGFAGHLWFLHTLFFVFLIFPMLIKLLKRPLIIFLFLVLLNLMPISNTDFFSFKHLNTLLLFFSLGYLLAHIRSEAFDQRGVFFLPFACVLAVLLVLREPIMGMFNALFSDDISLRLFDIIKISIGIMAYYFFSIFAKKYSVSGILKYIGGYLPPIYLLHTICMGVVRVFFIDILKVGPDLFPYISVIIFISGIVLPVLITRYVINKTGFLPPLILGARKT